MEIEERRYFIRKRLIHYFHYNYNYKKQSVLLLTLVISHHYLDNAANVVLLAGGRIELKEMVRIVATKIKEYNICCNYFC